MNKKIEHSVDPLSPDLRLASLLQVTAPSPSVSEALANIALIRLAPTAPHCCSIPNCPGNRNYEKLILLEEALNEIESFISNPDYDISYNISDFMDRCEHILCRARQLAATTT